MSPRPCLRRESAQEIDDGELLPLQQQHQQQQQQSRNNSKSLSIFPNSARKSLSPSPQHRSNFLSPSASLYKSAPGTVYSNNYFKCLLFFIIFGIFRISTTFPFENA